MNTFFWRVGVRAMLLLLFQDTQERTPEAPAEAEVGVKLVN